MRLKIRNPKHEIRNKSKSKKRKIQKTASTISLFRIFFI